MSASTPHTPSYRLHKPSNQAVVTLDGRDIISAGTGPLKAGPSIDRLLAEWLANGRRLPAPASGSDLTVNELVLAYLRHADSTTSRAASPRWSQKTSGLAIRPLCQLYGHTPAREFGPVAFKTVRRAMSGGRHLPVEINQPHRSNRAGLQVGRLGGIGPSVGPSSPKTVPGLRRGRADVRESEPVKPVPDAFVDAIQPFVARQVWAMVELQRLSGMRPGEVTSMRTCDIDTSGRVWIYTPSEHKTEHHGKERPIYLGPQAQAILKPWLRTNLTAYLFSPGRRWRNERSGCVGAERPPSNRPNGAGPSRDRRRPPASVTIQIRTAGRSPTGASGPACRSGTLTNSATTRRLGFGRNSAGRRSGDPRPFFASRDRGLRGSGSGEGHRRHGESRLTLRLARRSARSGAPAVESCPLA